MLYFDGWTRTSEIEAFLFLFSVDFLCFLFSLSLLFCSLFHASFHVCFGFFFLQYFHLILRFGIFICLGFWIDVCVLSNVYAFWHCFVIVGCRRIKKNIIYGKIRFFYMPFIQEKISSKYFRFVQFQEFDNLKLISQYVNQLCVNIDCITVITIQTSLVFTHFSIIFTTSSCLLMIGVYSNTRTHF